VIVVMKNIKRKVCNAGVEEYIENVVCSNDLFAPTEAAKPLLFNSGIRTAEGRGEQRNTDLSSIFYIEVLSIFYY
jgi:hypothetical protein